MAISSMTAVCVPQKQEEQGPFIEPHPSDCHWTRTCQHDLVARLKRYASGVRAKMQCRKCGLGVGGNVSMKGVLELWDEGLEQRSETDFREACDAWNERRIAWFDSGREENNAAWWAAYNAYLRTAVWAKKRSLVLERNRRLHLGLCESCGERPPSDVHHTIYPTSLGLAFGQEPLWVLQAVCRSCHEIFHPHMRKG